MRQEAPSTVYTELAPARDRRLLDRLLSALEPFRALSRQDLATVVTHSYVLELRRGDWIARRAERIPGLVVLGSGSAKLSLRRLNGDESVLRLVGPGEAFGLAATVLDRPCPVDVVALAPSVAAVVPPMPLQMLLESNLAFARAVSRALAARFLDLVGEVESSVQHNSAQRLAAFLLSLAVHNGNGAGWVSRLPATKTTVAARIGVKKETLSRLLHTLAVRGLIEVRGRDIAVLDRSGLARLADSGA